MATLTAAGVNFSDGTTINGSATNTIGSYAFLSTNDGASGTYNIGATKAGSQLRPSGVLAIGAYTYDAFRPAYTYVQATTMAGTWRIQGAMYSGDSVCAAFGGASLWVRIS